MERSTSHINLENWESNLAGYFTEEQKELLAVIAAHPYERPYPSHLDQTIQSPDNNACDAANIDSLPQFESWFKGIEQSFVNDQEQKLIDSKAELEVCLRSVQSLVEEIDLYENDISQLREKYEQTSGQTNSLHKACENLLKEQSDLVQGVEQISQKLNYFNEYEKIMQRLSSPMFNAKSESFNNLLQRIDECVDYLTKHPEYKESPNYIILFKRAQSKALVMIKTLFQSTLTDTVNYKDAVLHSAASGSSDKNGEEQTVKIMTNNSFSLLYGKFRAISSSMNVLIEQLEERSERFPECFQVLDDCEQLYFSARQTLVGQSVIAGVNELLIQHATDHCGLFRNGSFMILQVCLDEVDLYKHFFKQVTSDRMNTFLLTLCNYLYDALRPLIVHIIHLETLSELCSILKTEILADKVATAGAPVPAVFEQTCRAMLEDIQERLVYRTQMYMRSDILGYKPVSGDLAYPEKLQMMRDIAHSLKQQHNADSAGEDSSTGEDLSASGDEMKTLANRRDSAGSLFAGLPSATSSLPRQSDLSPADMHGMWYPTLRRTLVCLSKLYRCLDKEIFRGLSQETLACCIQSLQHAATQITSNKTHSDGQLFFIKHLLILREQIQPFQSDFSVKETVLDFSNTRTAGRSLMGKRDRLFSLSTNNALLEFLIEGSPQVTESLVDSKKDVDVHLKRYCETFVDYSVKTLCDPLLQFVDKAKVILEVKRDGQSKVNLRSQPFASPSKIQDIVGNTNKHMKTKLPKLKEDMGLYLANKDTEAILFKPVMNKVIRLFADVEGILTEYYTEEDRQIAGLPSSQELKLVLGN